MRTNTSMMRLLKHLLLGALPLGAQAQLLTNNGAVISSTAVISVNGGVLNQGATGLLDNNGILIISGDFTHNAPNNCFGTSAGEVGLNGGAQTIGGSSVAVFNYLELAGTGIKTLQQDVEVGGAYASPAGALFLNTQHLDLGTNTLTMRNADPTAIIRTNGFLISETDPTVGYSTVRWNIGEATGAYTIPFGNAATNSYLPFHAAITAAGTGTAGQFSLATYATNTLANPNNRPLPSGVPTLIDLSGMENAPNVLDRWWVMGASGHTTPPVADLRFTYRDSEWSTGTNTIVEGALQLERQQGTWTMFPTVTNTTANTLEATAIPLTAGAWTAAMLNTPLPVELLSFTAQRVDAVQVQLAWSTATEQNNAGFEVWRLIEGEDQYTHLAWVAGGGNSTSTLHYDLLDANPTDRISYYKLRQVDNDGRSTWSGEVAVAGRGAATQLLPYPNPARDAFSMPGDRTGWTSVQLFDVRGARVAEWPPMERYALSGIAPGVYTVRVMHTDGTAATARLAVE